MVKKKKKSRGVDAMEDDAPAVVESAPVPDDIGGREGKLLLQITRFRGLV